MFPYPLQISLFRIVLCIVGLAACAPGQPAIVASPTPSIATYPVIPIPSDVLYQGFSVYTNELGDINFYADEAVYPRRLGISFYAELLPQYGWETCKKADDFCYSFNNVTDTQFTGIYQYGQSENPPLLVIGINTMIENGQQITLFLRNCGNLTETFDPTVRSTEGCAILLSKEVATSVP